MEGLISINPQWFEPMPPLVAQAALLGITGACLAAVIKGADLLVAGASGIALRMGMSKVIIGATIVSLGTTTPECAVSVLAAWSGNPGLALGNAVGSIIADTGLIFGVGCLLTTLPVDRFLLNRQGWVQFGVAALLAAMCYGLWIFQGDEAKFPRVFGFVLLAVLVWYIWVSIRWGRQHAKAVARAHDEPEHLIEDAGHGSWPAMAVRFVVGLLLVILFGKVLISAVEILARDYWGVPDVVIASTIVAMGTSLPELVVGITAIRKGHPGLLIGNVIGADILNVLFVTGAAAAASPLPLIDPGAKIPAVFLLLHLPVMLVILGLFRLYIASAIKRGHFQRWNGWPLLAIYIAFIVLGFALSK